MSNKYGPSRGDLMFRLWFSIVGLGLMGVGLLYRGWPTGPAGVEAIAITLVFFGGTLGWTISKLRRHSGDQNPQ